MSKRDLIGLVEAAYDLRATTTAWLSEICHRARPFLDQGHGVIAWTFDVEDEAAPFRDVHCLGTHPACDEMPNRLRANLTQAETVGLHSHGPVITASDAFERVGIAYERFAAVAPTPDFLAVLGNSERHKGVLLGAPLVDRDRVDRGLQRRFSRIAVHLAAAYRLRRSLALRGAETATTHADAVLGPRGQVKHLDAARINKAQRDELSRATLALDRLRGRMRTTAPDRALEIWRGLVAGEWSLVDQEDADGQRHILAVKNPPGFEDPRGLTDRERAVLAYSMLGHPNKLIAYHLGLSPGTVSVHLKRALAKLRVRSVAELAGGRASGTDETS